MLEWTLKIKYLSIVSFVFSLISFAISTTIILYSDSLLRLFPTDFIYLPFSGWFLSMFLALFVLRKVKGNYKHHKIEIILSSLSIVINLYNIFYLFAVIMGLIIGPRLLFWH